MDNIGKWEYLLGRPYGNLTWEEKEELLQLLLRLTRKIKDLEDGMDYMIEFL